jgi:hypothetical protein
MWFLCITISFRFRLAPATQSDPATGNGYTTVNVGRQATRGGGRQKFQKFIHPIWCGDTLAANRLRAETVLQRVRHITKARQTVRY